MSDSDRDDRDEQGAPGEQGTKRGSLVMVALMGGLLAMVILINFC